VQVEPRRCMPALHAADLVLSQGRPLLPGLLPAGEQIDLPCGMDDADRTRG